MICRTATLGATVLVMTLSAVPARSDPVRAPEAPGLQMMEPRLAVAAGGTWMFIPDMPQTEPPNRRWRNQPSGPHAGYRAWEPRNEASRGEGRRRYADRPQYERPPRSWPQPVQPGGQWVYIAPRPQLERRTERRYQPKRAIPAEAGAERL
jgi:hypothetical protein